MNPLTHPQSATETFDQDLAGQDHRNHDVASLAAQIQPEPLEIERVSNTSQMGERLVAFAAKGADARKTWTASESIYAKTTAEKSLRLPVDDSSHWLERWA